MDSLWFLSSLLELKTDYYLQDYLFPHPMLTNADHMDVLLANGYHKTVFKERVVFALFEFTALQISSQL